jgi:acetyl esterase/lipase
MRVRLLLLLPVLAGALWTASCVRAQGEEVERIRDVIYHRKHGTALTMDILKPAKPSGIGVLWMVSGGWFSAHANINPGYVKAFTDRGMVVFNVVHGSQPKFSIQEILPDIDRATRFVRANARQYGVDPARLGISGGSAGGHLSLMQGALGGAGKANAIDPVDRESSRVQAVACFFPPTDFLNYERAGNNALLDMRLTPFRAAFGNKSEAPAEVERVAREISPVTHATKDMPPTLIIHGDADKLVPIQQAELMMKKLEELNVPRRLIVREGQAHGWPKIAEDVKIFADWFEEHIRK